MPRLLPGLLTIINLPFSKKGLIYGAMKKILLAISVGVLSIGSVLSQGPEISFNENSRQQVYAAARLSKALQENKYGNILANIPFKIQFALDKKLGAEAFSINSTASGCAGERNAVYQF